MRIRDAVFEVLQHKVGFDSLARVSRQLQRNSTVDLLLRTPTSMLTFEESLVQHRLYHTVRQEDPSEAWLEFFPDCIMYLHISHAHFGGWYNLNSASSDFTELLDSYSKSSLTRIGNRIKEVDEYILKERSKMNYLGETKKSLDDFRFAFPTPSKYLASIPGYRQDYNPAYNKPVAKHVKQYKYPYKYSQINLQKYLGKINFGVNVDLVWFTPQDFHDVATKLTMYLKPNRLCRYKTGCHGTEVARVLWDCYIGGGRMLDYFSHGCLAYEEWLSQYDGTYNMQMLINLMQQYDGGHLLDIQYRLECLKTMVPPKDYLNVAKELLTELSKIDSSSRVLVGLLASDIVDRMTLAGNDLDTAEAVVCQLAGRPLIRESGVHNIQVYM